MTTQQTIGELILERREAELMTVEQLAAEIGLTPNTVYRHQAGVFAPRMETLAEYCRVLGIDGAKAAAARAESRRRAKR